MCNRVNASTIYFLLYKITLSFFFKNLNRSTYIINANSLQNYERKREEKYLRVEFWPENWHISFHYWWGHKEQGNSKFDMRHLSHHPENGRRGENSTNVPRNLPVPLGTKVLLSICCPCSILTLHKVSKELIPTELANLNSHVRDEKKKTKVLMSSAFLLHPWSWNSLWV